MNITALFRFTWRTNFIDPCPKCRALDGREYMVSDIYQPFLTDPQFGAVWSLDGDHSLAHGGAAHNCRCSLDVELVELEVDMDALNELEALL